MLATLPETQSNQAVLTFGSPKCTKIAEALLKPLLLALAVEDDHPVKLHNQRLRIIIEGLYTR
jgi:hypothetical protein